MSNLTRIKRIFITLAITAGVFLLLGIISFFAMRNYILTEAIVKISEKVNTKFNVTLNIKDARFTGLTTVEFNNVSIKPSNHDSILFATKITTSVKLRYAILGDIRLGELHVNDGYLNWVNDERGRNVNAFLNSKDSSNVTNDENVSDKNLAKTGYKLISKVLNFIPSDLQITNFDVKVTDFKHHIGVKINNLALINQQLNSNIAVSSFKDSIDSRLFTQNWQLSGTAIPSQKKADIQLTNNDTGKVLIPYIAERFGLIAGFDNIRFNLKGVDLSKNELVVTGLASTYNFLINHPKIAKKDVIIEKAELDYTFIIGSNFVSLDSTSTITFNKIKVHPFVKYQRGPDTTYQLNVVIEKTTAQDFIYSLPEGLFNHFKGMEAEGTFSYRLDFLYNENNPRDLVFESSLQKEGLRITKYGEANLSKLNSEFVYQAMENGRVQRNIDVSYNNPNFVPIDQISPLLKKAVLTTEDPSFFYHRGFIDEAFRQSIIKNIRKKGFVRGASTISMQLVKNVFLTREKTLSRKLEEILLVYILENNRLSSKERMFEVYLNIIEWGPNVYGIGEAARFYFNKSASDLTLSEAMYLAIIIPSPKKFMWRFGKDGALKDHVGRHFQSLAGLMIRRNVLMQEDTMGLTHHISITGPAKGFIKVTADTLQNDSILFDENGILIEPDED